jgi:3-hydroxyisobutyrate dehydrogenase-like beta-hydroxyacid dehydrogenase
MVERVGIVGMGLMGQAFIANMRKSQIAVQGFDLDPVRMDQLREQGGQPVDSPAAAARGVDHVVTSLPNSDVARAVQATSPNAGSASSMPRSAEPARWLRKAIWS